MDPTRIGLWGSSYGGGLVTWMAAHDERVKCVVSQVAPQDSRALQPQTAGGALGSMIAPAKIIVGCSTTGQKNKDAEVLRITLPYGLSIGLLVGIVTLVITQVLKL